MEHYEEDPADAIAIEVLALVRPLRARLAEVERERDTWMDRDYHDCERANDLLEKLAEVEYERDEFAYIARNIGQDVQHWKERAEDAERERMRRGSSPM